MINDKCVLKEGRYQYDCWHVMGNASDVIECDTRTPELSV